MDPIEILAALLGVLSVWLMARKQPWAWPVGLAMVLLYAWVFFHARLYSDMLLQLVYAVLQLYGWWQWLRGGPGHTARPVSNLPKGHTLRDLGVGAALTVALGWGMHSWTNANAPWLDAALTGFSLVGQYWMAHKRVQCWLLWLVVDVVYVGMFLWLGMYVTAALYAVFIGLAVYGWQQWRLALAQQSAPDTAAQAPCAS